MYGDHRMPSNDTDGWPRLLHQMGALSVELYRLALNTPIDQFQQLALDAVRPALGFDTACWTVAGAEYQGLALPTSNEDADESNDIPGCEYVIAKALANTGASVLLPTSDPSMNSPVACAHRQGAMEAPIKLLPNLCDIVIFHRRDPGSPFTRAECTFVASLVPLLSETWRINQLRSVQGDRRRTAQINEAQALCDGRRFLHAAGRNFLELMQLEWRDWNGPQLPVDLLRDGGRTYLGKRIVITLTPASDLMRLSIRKRTRADCLTPRERDIARRFGQGLDYREVAEELRIAPATARNHLKNIYGKLEINSKVELASLMRQIERPGEIA